jgi:hypothetical protein
MWLDIFESRIKVTLSHRKYCKILKHLEGKHLNTSVYTQKYSGQSLFSVYTGQRFSLMLTAACCHKGPLYFWMEAVSILWVDKCTVQKRSFCTDRVVSAPSCGRTFDVPSAPPAAWPVPRATSCCPAHPEHTHTGNGVYINSKITMLPSSTSTHMGTLTHKHTRTHNCSPSTANLSRHSRQLTELSNNS